MSMTRSLAQLKEECQVLGLQVEIPKAKNGKPKESKEIYIQALQSYNIRKRYPDGKIPQHLQLILTLDTPMLADRFHARKDEEQAEIMNSPLWGFQEKMDGVRMWTIYCPGEGYHFYSRNISVEDYLPVEYCNIAVPEDLSARTDELGLPAFILDQETVCTNPNISTVMGSRGVVTETQLQAVAALLALNDEDSLRIQREEGMPLKFWVFDCPFYGEWLDETHRALPQTEREKVSTMLVSLLSPLGLNAEHLCTVYDPEAKKAFYQQILDANGEGVIAKHANALYRGVESRSRNQWIKIKRSMSGSLTATEYNDTLDAFVSGFGLGEEGKGYEGMVGFLRFSVWLTKDDGSREQHEIASVSTIPMATRKKITALDSNGMPTLHPAMYGMVAEIDGVNVSARAKRIRHAKIVRWRDDKMPDDCTLSEKFLHSMIF